MSRSYQQWEGLPHKGVSSPSLEGFKLHWIKTSVFKTLSEAECVKSSREPTGRILALKGKPSHHAEGWSDSQTSGSRGHQHPRLCPAPTQRQGGER